MSNWAIKKNIVDDLADMSMCKFLAFSEPFKKIRIFLSKPHFWPILAYFSRVKFENFQFKASPIIRADSFKYSQIDVKSSLEWVSNCNYWTNIGWPLEKSKFWLSPIFCKKCQNGRFWPFLKIFQKIANFSLFHIFRKKCQNGH